MLSTDRKRPKTRELDHTLEERIRRVALHQCGPDALLCDADDPFVGQRHSALEPVVTRDNRIVLRCLHPGCTQPLHEVPAHFLTTKPPEPKVVPLDFDGP